MAFGKANIFNGSAAEGKYLNRLQAFAFKTMIWLSIIILLIAIDCKPLREAVGEKSRYNKKPVLNDFTRLNKVVLREGATNAAANRALRVNHEMKIVQKTGRN